MAAPTVVLIGPMAAGKTRTGKRVARALGLPLLDSDKMVVAEHGAISAIFAEHGEAYFRELERKAVRSALSSAGVVSLGGGAVLHPETQAELAALNVVYLSTSADAVAARLSKDVKRPLVANGGVERWSEILAERKPIYERLAKLQIDTSNRPMAAVAAEVLDWLQSTGKDSA